MTLVEGRFRCFHQCRVRVAAVVVVAAATVSNNKYNGGRGVRQARVKAGEYDHGRQGLLSCGRATTTTTSASSRSASATKIIAPGSTAPSSQRLFWANETVGFRGSRRWLQRVPREKFGSLLTTKACCLRTCLSCGQQVKRLKCFGRRWLRVLEKQWRNCF